mgnify:CR=1 FL=1
MLKVKNKRILRKLSARILTARRSKNLIALAAILLTSVLFTTVFSVGGNLLQSQTESTCRQVGTSTHAGFKYLTEAEYEQMKNDPEIRDVSYNIMAGFVVNSELDKLQCEVRYFEPLDAEHSFSYPTTGEMPQEENEIAMSTIVLDALGIPHKLGEEVSLTIRTGSRDVTDTFILCGFWEGDPIAGAQEILVSRIWCDREAPLKTTPFYESEDEDVSGYINVSFNFSNSFNIEGKIEELIERCGFDPDLVNSGVNWAYGFSSIDPVSVSILIVLLLLIILSGYLIIYNVFYLNIFSDIRFYGLLKTIGTTGRQLKKIVRRQAWTLCLFGVPAGLILGWIIGRFITPAVLSMLTDVYASYSLNPLIFIGSALFTVFTVHISCIRPCRTAAKVSPIEAVRYTEKPHKRKSKKTKKASALSMALSNLRRNTRRLILVVLSLSLSMILLNSVYTIVTGFDMDKYISAYLLTDCAVADATVFNPSGGYQEIHGITDDFLNDLSGQEGVSDIGNVYLYPVKHQWSDSEWTQIEQIMDDPVYQDFFGLPALQQSFDTIRETRSSTLDLYGADDRTAEMITMLDENLDLEKFKSGDYVIVNAYGSSDSSGDFASYYLDPGDSVTLDFGNGNSKTYEVLAIGQMPNPLTTQSSTLIGEEFILPAEELLAQCGEMQPLKTVFNITDGRENEVISWLRDYCENVNSDLDCRTRADYQDAFNSLQRTYALTGGFLSGILALIGILNFVNVTVTSILSRSQELAMMESIGMTGKQQRRMLQAEGLCYAALTLLISCTAGVGVSYLFVQAVAGQMWMFTWRFTLMPVALCAPFLIAIALIVPSLCHAAARRRSVVERLSSYLVH